METKRSCISLFLQALFKAYLWGMETYHILCYNLPFSRLKPTYEEWKLKNDQLARLCGFGLKPTYEEWKPLSTKLIKRCLMGLKPTYEEWKLPKRWDRLVSRSPFKAYLWGMETECFQFWKIDFDEFKAYLWGMETPCGSGRKRI